MTGTFVNAAAVIAGSALGLIVHTRLPKRFVDIVFQGLGLVTLVIGVTMSLRSSQPIILILSIALGAVLGQWADLEVRVKRWAEALKKGIRIGDKRFAEALTTAFMMYCMGSMTIIGAMEEGLGRGADLLYAKSVLDGCVSIAFASTLGIGVLFSVIPLLIYQGAWTLVGFSLERVIDQAVINEIGAVGGLLLIGLGLNILEIKRIPLMNLLPALLIAIILGLLLPEFGISI